MDTAQPPVPPPLPIAPPVYPGIVQKELMWPKVIGIISIIVGGWGTLMGCWGVISIPFSGAMMKWMPRPAPVAGSTAPDPMQTMADVIHKWMPELMTVGIINLCVAGLLVFAGVRLLQFKRRGVTLHWAYSWVRLGALTATVVVTFLYTQDIMQATMAMQGQIAGPNAAGAAIGRSFGMVAGYIGVVFTAIMGLMYPVFLMVWFSTAGVKKDCERLAESLSALDPPGAI